MKKIIFCLIYFLSLLASYPQSFEIKQITSGDFDARNPVISPYGFMNGWIYFEKHTDSSSNIVLIEYNAISNSFQDTIELTSGNAIRINPYIDFNQGIVFQTNERGNWDIAYRSYYNGVWDSTIFLTNSFEDEINLSQFFVSDPGFPSNNFVLFRRADTVIVLEYNESVIAEYPVFVNNSQYQYSDCIGIYYSYSPNNYPRVGIHVVAVEIDSLENRNLVFVTNR